MEYKDLEKVNDELTTIDIKGKDYVEVNKRVLAFRKFRKWRSSNEFYNI